MTILVKLTRLEIIWSAFLISLLVERSYMAPERPGVHHRVPRGTVPARRNRLRRHARLGASSTGVTGTSQQQRPLVLGPDEGHLVPIGESTVRLLSVGGDTANLSSVEEIRVPAGFAGPPPHLHRVTNHSWFVIQGTLHLSVDGVAHDLPAGGFVYVPVGSAHTFANPTRRDARMVEFTTPGGFDAYLRELSEAFPVGTVIDRERMIEIMARHDTFPVG